MAKGLQYRALFTALAGLLYGVSPIDIIPDLIPFVGILDDAVIVPALLIMAFMHFKKAKRLERQESVSGPGVVFDMPTQTPPRSRV